MTKKFQGTSLKDFPAVFNLTTLDGTNGYRIRSSHGCSLSHSIAADGDINGDGLIDLCISAPDPCGTDTSFAGVTYVIFGSKLDFEPSFNLTKLNGTNGFSIEGLASPGGLGWKISMGGDINADGIDDFAMTALYVNSEAGKAYIIFGTQKPFNATYDLTTLDGKSGFTVSGPAQGSVLDQVVISGDVNGDGIDDLGLGTFSGSGESYIIFGSKRGFPSSFNLNNLYGSNGFRINGAISGSDTMLFASGDINGDGFSDLGLTGNGEYSYVIFGSNKSFPNPFSLTTLNGSNGFKISGKMSVNGRSSLFDMNGDVNGDGLADIVLGTWNASPGGKKNAGEVYVIYGTKSTFPAAFNLNSLNGVNGFTIPGLSADDQLGAVATGNDLNNDNISDLVLGAWGVESGTGEAYVVFGSRFPFPRSFNLTTLNGQNGFKVPGLAQGDYLGVTVAAHGNIDGNGKGEIIVGKHQAPTSGPTERGGAYVIFIDPNVENYGMLSVADHFKPMNSSSDTGMVKMGINEQWCNTNSLHIGDVNGDNMSDLLCNMNAQNSIMLATRAGYDVTFIPIDGDPDGKTKVGVNDQWCDNVSQELLTGDFNADSKTDLLCRSVKGEHSGQNYVMLSNGTAFNSMTSSSYGQIQVGELGKFCANSSRLIIGDFDGKGSDDLLCNTYDPLAGNMIMIPNGTDFTSINSDILGRVTMGDQTECFINWCQEIGSVLKAGDFNADGKSDLLCNFQGKNMIMLSSIGTSWPCDFKPITSNGKTSSDGYISIGKNQQWCDTSKFKLLVEDVNGDQMVDLVCNERGLNKIMLCESDGADGYQFKSINATNTEGQVYMGDHSKWCLSQNLLGGDYNGDTLGDLLCNQGGQIADHLDYGW